MATKSELLRQSIHQELRRNGIDRKMNFWGQSAPDPTPGEDSADLENLLGSVRTGDRLTDTSLPALECSGHELLWGKPVPPQVEQQRQAIFKKARSGQKLTADEELFIKLASTDTDMF